MPRPVVSLSRRVRRLKIEQYLRGLHCVRFPGDIWDLTDPKELEQAVDWVEELLGSVA